MAPIWKLLRSEGEKEDWTQQHKGGLKSAMAGRQFTQSRAKNGQIITDASFPCTTWSKPKIHIEASPPGRPRTKSPQRMINWQGRRWGP